MNENKGAARLLEPPKSQYLSDQLAELTVVNSPLIHSQMPLAYSQSPVSRSMGQRIDSVTRGQSWVVTRNTVGLSWRQLPQPLWSNLSLHIQRRIKAWKAKHGPAKEVMLPELKGYSWIQVTFKTAYCRPRVQRSCWWIACYPGHLLCLPIHSVAGIFWPSLQRRYKCVICRVAIFAIPWCNIQSGLGIISIWKRKLKITIFLLVQWKVFLCNTA